SSSGSITITRPTGEITCPATVDYQSAPAPFCSGNFGQAITFKTVKGAAKITPGSNGANLTLSTVIGAVTITSATAPGTTNYTPVTVTSAAPLSFTTVLIPVHLAGCQFKLSSNVSGNVITTMLSDMPANAFYGDTVQVSG